MSRHGENIRKRKDGRWEGRYGIYEPRCGKKIVRSVYARTYEEVKEKLLSARICAESGLKGKMADTNIQFHTAAQEWLNTVEKKKKYATYIKYQSIYEKYIRENTAALTASDFGDIVPATLFREKERFLSDSLKRSIICVLNQILSYADLQYHTGYFRYSYQKQGSGNKPVRVLNQTEQAKLLQCLYHKTDIYKTGILLCFSTGLRLGEICSLKWSDIDLKEKVLHVNTTVQRIAVKGKKEKTMLLEGYPKSCFSEREIPLSEDIVRLLTPYYSTTAKYVVNQNKPMEPRTYQNKFYGYLKTAGVEKKNFHTLRHTFATNCINSGTDVKSLSEILGHSDVKITLNRYVHPTLETKRQHMNSLAVIYGQIMGQEQKNSGII